MDRKLALFFPPTVALIVIYLLWLGFSQPVIAASTVAPLQNVVQISAGSEHACALLSAGGVKCWGNNSYGQLGNNSTVEFFTTPIDVIGLSSGVSQTVAGIGHSCAVLTSGGLKCWGYNVTGQLGDNSTTTRRSPVDVNGLSSGVRMAAVSQYHSCALLVGGSIKCWGKNSEGQLGDGTPSGIHKTAVAVNGLGGVASAVVVGDDHTCALLNNGKVQCWGSNGVGQLGDGNSGLGIHRAVPGDVIGLAAEVRAITAGENHTCALLVTGAVQCWGSNSGGQIDVNIIGDIQSTPVDVTGLSSGVKQIAAGRKHTCVLVMGGSVKCWGYNIHAQLGNGQFEEQSAVVDVGGLASAANGITAGSYFSCALLINSTMQCWGWNGYGELGDGAVGAASKLPITVTNLSNALAIAPGVDHTCVLNGDAGVECWGHNYNGEFGDGTGSHRAVPFTIPGIGNLVRSVYVGEDYTCALLLSGGVKCWGSNSEGQIGNDTANYFRNPPTDVFGLTSGVRAVAAGRQHVCAVTTSNVVQCWGKNFYGQLGNGSSGDKSMLPVAVISTTGVISTVAAGDNHSCAVTHAGAVECWGRNNFGQLGDGTLITHTTPVTVSGLVGSVVAVEGGGGHTCALLVNGTVQCWGANNFGQLGDNSLIDRTTAVTVTGLVSNTQAIAVGYHHSCALLKSSGKVKCWGNNYEGQLGDGTYTHHRIPVVVVGLAGTVVAIGAGETHTCAVLSNGFAQCWGINSKGQLGTGDSWRTAPVAVLDPNAPPTPTATITPTASATVTPTATATPSATSTSTATSSPTVRVTPLPGAGDTYEADNSCATANPIEVTDTNPVTDTLPAHTFHTAQDEDWVSFDAIVNANYRIEVTVPDSSAADVDLEVHETCPGGVISEWSKSFNPGVRLDFTANTNKVYLRLSNVPDAATGPTVSYHLSVRRLREDSRQKALIIVAGRLYGADPLQKNIHNIAESVYAIYSHYGYTDTNILTLATTTLPGQHDFASKENLKEAITVWAKGQLGSNGLLTLYMVDHGDGELFYIDEANAERVSPAELDEWLTQLEKDRPGVRINIIIEACESGSFIEGATSISKSGRIVITSTDEEQDAKASLNGAYFSDQLLAQMAQGYNLAASFGSARKAAKLIYERQEAWLDANGNGIVNEFDDATEAAQHGFLYSNSLGEEWAPYIFSAQGPVTITNFSGVITAEVRDDDEQVAQVWAVVYPPDYTPPASTGELQPENLHTFLLQPIGNHQYAGTFTGFTQPGSYRFLIHAKDDKGLAARPYEVRVFNGGQLFLPLVMR